MTICPPVTIPVSSELQVRLWRCILNRGPSEPAVGVLWVGWGPRLRGLCPCGCSSLLRANTPGFSESPCVLEDCALVRFFLMKMMRNNLYSIGPQHVWYQGLVSWKTTFPRTRVGDGFQMVREDSTYCACHFYYYCYYIRFSDGQALEPSGWGPLFSRMTATPCGHG